MDDDPARRRMQAVAAGLCRVALASAQPTPPYVDRRKIYADEHIDERPGREGRVFWSANLYDGEAGWQDDRRYPSRAAAERGARRMATAMGWSLPPLPKRRPRRARR